MGTETKSRGGSNPNFVSSLHLVLELDPRVLQSGFLAWKPVSRGRLPQKFVQTLFHAFLSNFSIQVSSFIRFEVGVILLFVCS